MKEPLKASEEERTMERDVRATERPVTQRFCTINTSCSRGGGGSSQSSHTRARARTQHSTACANGAPPGERRKLSPSDWAAGKAQHQRLRGCEPGRMHKGFAC